MEPVAADDWERRVSPASGFGRPSCVLAGAASGARLSLRADEVGEAGDAGGGERAQEFVEWPGWIEVGGLLFECGAYGVGVEVV
jgi:hypothetical protein